MLLSWKQPLVRLVALALALAPLILLGIVAVLWVGGRTPEWVFWKIGLVFLIAVEILAATAAVIAFSGGLFCGILIFSTSRRTKSRGTLARGLLLSVSILAALATVEVVSALWQYRSHHGTALPVGGLRGTHSPRRHCSLWRCPRSINCPPTFPMPTATARSTSL